MNFRLQLLSAIVLAFLVTGGNMASADIWPFKRISDNPHKRWSPEWYCFEAERPTGARQKCKYGKPWPPRPRPTGPKQQFSHKYHAAHYWPHPYVCDDRAYLQMVSDAQVRAGWTKATTLYDYHFEEETQTLNHSGVLHLQWILGHVPAEHRVTYIQKSYTPGVNEIRLAGVQQAATEMLRTDRLPPIQFRTTYPVGRPAIEVDAIRRAELETQPAPQIVYEALPSGNAN